MKTFYGTKLVQARPMSRLDYNSYRGWTLPTDENGADEGYLVEYLDGGERNHPLHEGYVSWSPKAQFEGAYRESGRMSFGHALEALEAGTKVARAGWNGKGMWLQLVGPAAYDVSNRMVGESSLLPWIGMKTADNGFVPWLASQTDMLAKDWGIVA